MKDRMKPFDISHLGGVYSPACQALLQHATQTTRHDRAYDDNQLPAIGEAAQLLLTAIQS